MCVCAGVVEASALVALIVWLRKERAKLKADEPIAPPRLRDTLYKGK